MMLQQADVAEFTSMEVAVGVCRTLYISLAHIVIQVEWIWMSHSLFLVDHEESRGTAGERV